jgi:hypothetical protein
MTSHLMSCSFNYTAETDKCNQTGRLPCFNNGTCKNDGIRFKCLCPDGFAGLRCETG